MRNLITVTIAIWITATLMRLVPRPPTQTVLDVKTYKITLSGKTHVILQPGDYSTGHLPRRLTCTSDVDLYTNSPGVDVRKADGFWFVIVRDVDKPQAIKLTAPATVTFRSYEEVKR